MLRASFTFARVKGIPIGAHWSWLVVFVLVVWSLASSLFPGTYPGLADATYIVMALIAAILFFVSILLHELGHAFAALREDMEMEAITLWLFGGVAQFRGTLPSPGAEFRIAIAGPLVSAVIAGFFGGLTVLDSVVNWPDAVQGVTDYLWRINGLVLLFNLVPALPLDGGRVLRALLWHQQKSFTAATYSAALAGKAFGWVLIGIGVLNITFGGPGNSSLWLAFLGWFLIEAARAEETSALIQDLLRGREVAELMTPHPTTVTPDLSVGDFLNDVARKRPHHSYPVVREGEGDGGFVGLVSVGRASTVPPADRERLTVGEVAIGRGQGADFGLHTDAADALRQLQRPPHRAAVLDDGRVVGIVSSGDMRRAIEIETARGFQRPRARRAGLWVWAVVTLIMALAAGSLFRPAVVILEPGITLDVTQDIRISGTPTDDVNGRYLLTSVRVEQPSGLEALIGLASGQEVLPLSAVMPAGTDPDEFAERQRDLFEQSRLVAAAAAARASGMNVAVHGSGAVVVDILPNSPAQDVLQRGDVIVAINGEPVEVAPDVQKAIGSRPPGTTYQLTFERDGVRRTVRVSSQRLEPTAGGIVGIGVLIESRDFELDLPFQVTFQDRDIGGPSAGLAYALAVADILQEDDLAGGKTIAATGTIDLDGRVGPVGGLEAKAVAAAEGGGEIMLAPEGDIEDAEQVEDLDARAVSTLEEALRFLRSQASSSS